MILLCCWFILVHHCSLLMWIDTMPIMWMTSQLTHRLSYRKTTICEGLHVTKKCIPLILIFRFHTLKECFLLVVEKNVNLHTLNLVIIYSIQETNKWKSVRTSFLRILQYVNIFNLFYKTWIQNKHMTKFVVDESNLQCEYTVSYWPTTSKTEQESKMRVTELGNIWLLMRGLLRYHTIIHMEIWVRIWVTFLGSCSTGPYIMVIVIEKITNGIIFNYL